MWYLLRLPDFDSFVDFEQAFVLRFGASVIDISYSCRQFRRFRQNDNDNVTTYLMTLSLSICLKRRKCRREYEVPIIDAPKRETKNLLEVDELSRALQAGTTSMPANRTGYNFES